MTKKVQSNRLSSDQFPIVQIRMTLLESMRTHTRDLILASDCYIFKIEGKSLRKAKFTGDSRIVVLAIAVSNSETPFPYFGLFLATPLY